MSTRTLSVCLAVGFFFVGAGPARAQFIGGAGLSRGLSSGSSVPYDGEPFSHRYNYGSGPYLYLNGSPRDLWMQYHLDKEDRAERFGHLRSTKPPILNRLQERRRRK